MSTATIERTEVITPAQPLTEGETNSLITLAASAEKVARVPGSVGSVRVSRAWQTTGAPD